MFRTIRRAPWIALGAAGAYYLDGANGPARRRDARDRIRTLKDQARDKIQNDLRSGGSDPMETPSSAPAEMSGTFGTGTSWEGTNALGEEHRRSEETVAPSTGYSGYSDV